MDPAFQVIQEVMAKQNGPESTRYCGGCHDPISLFSGTKNVFTEDLSSVLGYQEGVSCLVCHSVRETDLKGNANYTLAQPERYLLETGEGAPAKFVSDFLIRAYPRKHVEVFSKRLLRTPEYCAACHKQFIDEEVNQVGWVQLRRASPRRWWSAASATCRLRSPTIRRPATSWTPTARSTTASTATTASSPPTRSSRAC
jgi:hypothetical protein